MTSLPPNLVTIGAVAAVLLMFAALLKALAKKSATEPAYTRKQEVLSAAERQFFCSLKDAAPEYDFFPKMRLPDILNHKKERHGDFTRISQKHFDWVMCDKDTSAPIAAIELDDSSHLTDRARHRDGVKNSACTSAKLPLVRFKYAKKYDKSIIRNTLIDAVSLAP